MLKTVRQLQRSLQNDTLFFRVAGGVFVALGLLLVSSGELTTLSCSRVKPTQGNCQLISSGLLGSKVRATQLSELQGAKIEDNPMDDDTSRVTLLTRKGEVLLSKSTDDKIAEATVSEINTFIQHPERTSLTIEQDERGIYFPVGGLVIAAGLLTIGFSRTFSLYLQNASTALKSSKGIESP
jgi:hypothetical protein